MRNKPFAKTKMRRSADGPTNVQNAKIKHPSHLNNQASNKPGRTVAKRRVGGRG